MTLNMKEKDMIPYLKLQKMKFLIYYQKIMRIEKTKV